MNGRKSEGEDHESAAIIRIAYTIIQEAIKDGANEISIEPMNPTLTTYHKIGAGDGPLEDAQFLPVELGLRVSYRIGEDWQEVMPLPDYIREPIIRRFKQMAGIDLSRSDISQEGHIPVRYEGQPYKLLVSTIPTQFSERVQVRLIAS